MAKTRRVRTQTASDKLFKKPVSQLDMLTAISGDAKKIVTLDDLEPIPAVPTIFTSFNRAVVLQGAPGKTTWVIHGPPGGGKTAFCLGIASSFVANGHVAIYIDAEYALEKKWVVALKTLTGGIMMYHPESFEDAFDQVDIWIHNFAKAKADGKIPEDRLCIIFVDTIHKLPPKREIEQLAAFKPNHGKTKHGGDNINKGWGMLRANMITSWVDHLTPQVSKHGISFVALAHEKEEKNDDWGKPDYKVKGGSSLLFEAMVRIRIAQGKKQFEEIGGKKYIVGQEHVASVEKNKVGHPHEFFRFFTSNGKGVAPAGFDLTKEAVTEALWRKVLITSGSWIYLPYDRTQKFQGSDQLMSYLRENPTAMEEFTEFLNDDLANPDDYEYKSKEDTEEE